MTEERRSPSEILSNVEERKLPRLEEWERSRYIMEHQGGEREFHRGIGATIKASIEAISGDIEQEREKNPDSEIVARCTELARMCSAAVRNWETLYTERLSKLYKILTTEKLPKLPLTFENIWDGVVQILGEKKLRTVRCKINNPEVKFQANLDTTALPVAELVRNALEAVERKKREAVDVIFDVKGDDVMVSVSDEGGMKGEIADILEDKPGLLEKDRFPRDCFPGPGLGLAIVRAIVERLDGETTFKTIEDVGSIFTMRIPLKSLQ